MNRRWLDRYDPGQPLGAILFFWMCQTVVAVLLLLVYRMRQAGNHLIPPTGPLLVVANHQSHLDPPMVGVALRRRHIVPLARSGLFTNPIFGRVLKLVNSIPLREDGSDAAAMRSAIAQLQRGRCVLIFPEGSRCQDGAVHEFKRGTWLLMKRAQCPILPAAVEGAFDAWPRSRLLPRLFGARVAVAFGAPISPETFKTMGSDEALDVLRRRIDELRLDLRRQLRTATHGRYPAPGPGDAPALSGAAGPEPPPSAGPGSSSRARRSPARSSR